MRKINESDGLAGVCVADGEVADRESSPDQFVEGGFLGLFPSTCEAPSKREIASPPTKNHARFARWFISATAALPIGGKRKVAKRAAAAHVPHVPAIIPHRMATAAINTKNMIGMLPFHRLC